MATITELLEELRLKMKNSPEGVRAWYDNIACAIKDEGVAHATANRAAARIMKLCFRVEINAQQHRSPDNQTKH